MANILYGCAALMGLLALLVPWYFGRRQKNSENGGSAARTSVSQRSSGDNSPNIIGRGNKVN